MIRRRAALSAGFAALGLSSCAEQPRQAPVVTRTAPLVTDRAPPAPPPSEAAPARSAGKVTRIPLGTFSGIQQSGQVLIFDVRPAFHFGLGHIPGAINWPRGRFESQLAIHEPRIASAAAAGIPVVLYCTDLACPDAREIATRLASRGHPVAVLEGGWEAWNAGGLPTE
jgi:rhodanese-related sulfurtransferase